MNPSYQPHFINTIVNNVNSMNKNPENIYLGIKLLELQYIR